MAKTSNGYADSLGAFYTDTPKAVLAALALSAAEQIDPGRAHQWLRDEWEILHQNGIVPQKAPK